MENGQGVGGIYIAGHRGMVGSAIHRMLESAGEANVTIRAFTELDLGKVAAADEFFSTNRPTKIYLAVARVGDIQTNSAYAAEFNNDGFDICSTPVKPQCARQFLLLLLRGL